MLTFNCYMVRILICLSCISLIGGCKTPEKQVENYLHASIHRKQYQDFNPETMKMAMRIRLNSQYSEWYKYPWLKKYYIRHAYEPYFVSHFLAKNQIDTLLNYLQSAKDHGLKSSFYQYQEIDSLFLFFHPDIPSCSR